MRNPSTSSPGHSGSSSAVAGGLTLVATDVSEQKRSTARDVPPDGSVGELIKELIAGMGLPRNGNGGEELNYHALLPREGRHLHASERIGEALRSGDQIVLQPNIDAGARCGR